MNGRWIEIKIVTKSEVIEPVSGIFYGLDVKGVAIEDPNDIILQEQNSLRWDYVDANIFEYGNAAAVVKGYFSDEDNIDSLKVYIREKLNELTKMGFDIGEGKIIINDVYEKDWANEWKKYYKSLKIGNRIVINPLWEDYTPKDDEILVNMDPGMAFGTGTHETTMMCVEYLEKYVQKNNTVFDIGTGSGILSIVAAKLGAVSVKGVDLDQVAVEVAKDNVKINDVQDSVEIKYGDLVEVIEDKADIIVSNIMADVIIYLTSIIKPFLNDDGIFITSGIIKDRKDDVLEALKNNSFEVIEFREQGEWVAIVAKHIS